MGFIFHDDHWTSSAFRVGVFKPTQWFRDQLQPYPLRLALRLGDNGSVRADDGFAAYRLVFDDCSAFLLVPELNLFAAVRQRIDGRREVYSNIELVEPDPQLFGPPPGVSVQQTEDPLNRQRSGAK
jgi:hypothetical protein